MVGWRRRHSGTLTFSSLLHFHFLPSVVHFHFLLPLSLLVSSISGKLSLLFVGVGELAARGHEDSIWPGPERECLIEVKNHLQRRLNKPIMDISEPDFSLVVSFKYVLLYCQWWSHKILCEVKCTLPIKNIKKVNWNISFQFLYFLNIFAVQRGNNLMID